MNRNLNYLISTLITLLLLTACGGVASNPTAPTFTPPGSQGTEGEQPDLTGQLSGGGAEMGEEIIQGNFETLWPQGLGAMERGQSVVAAQYFQSAFAARPDSADAALAFAIADVMRDYRRYSLFLHPGVDKLFMSTPLAGIAEAFPNPFLAEDSYFLRLAALGRRTNSLMPEAMFPTIAPIDTNSVFNPLMYESLMGGIQRVVSPDEMPPQPGAMEGSGETLPPPPPGDPSGRVPEPAPPGGERPTEGPHGMSSPEMKPLPGKQGADLAGGGGDGDDGGGVDDPGIRGEGGFPAGFGGPAAPPGAAVLPEREAPISEDEWEAMIRQYRDSAARDGADILLCTNFYQNVQAFHEEIIEHISNLESVRTTVETEGYSLPLPFNALDGTQKVTLMFDVDDYHLILDHYQLLDVILKYVLAYNHQVPYVLPTDPIEDENNDGVLSPDEFLPNTPFGTLEGQGRGELSELLSEFINVLNSLSNDMRPLLDAALEVQAGDLEQKKVFYLSSFHRNYVLIGEWAELLQDIAEKSTSGTAIKLASGASVTEVVAVYDAIFNEPITDIRDYMPSFDAVTRVAITDDDGNWNSDPTFSGFYREGLPGPEPYTASGRLSVVVYDEEMGKAEGYMVRVNNSNAEVAETGLATIDNTLVNELVGTPFSVMDASGQEIKVGAVRSHFEIIPLFDISVVSMMFGPPAGDQAPPHPPVGPGAAEFPPGEPGMVTAPEEGATGDEVPEVAPVEPSDEETGDEETAEGEDEGVADEEGDEEDEEVAEGEEETDEEGAEEDETGDEEDQPEDEGTPDDSGEGNG